MQNKIAPSMMCVDFSKIEETLCIFEQCGIEYLHVDIMDGQFVPNFTLGIDFCEKMRKMSNIPLDIHLMIEQPENKLDWFGFKPNEYVSLHWESTVHIQRALAQIRSHGAKPMVALNPATPVSVLEYVLDDIDGVLIMTVNPGYAGQKLVPAAMCKIAAARAYLNERGYEHVEIQVDGNVSFENTVKMRAAGANIFVGGSSSIFSVQQSIAQNIAQMRALL